MPERLYTDHPEVYDAIQSGWDYDRDTAFVRERLAEHGVDGRRLLELGCGTGEHTRRFVADGFDVTAVDAYEGTLERAREKCAATFRRARLPELPVEGVFDACVAIRGVVNHLAPGALRPTFSAVHARLVEGGVFVFDNSPLPPGGNDPALDVDEAGRYARVAHHAPKEDRLEWREAVFTGEDAFVSTREMTPFDDSEVARTLERVGFGVERHEGYGPGDDRTVFVGRA